MSKSKRTRQWPQYLAAISATLSLAVVGSHIGWTSPVLPYLKSPESHLPVTSDDASWIASFYLLGNVPGSILAGFIVDLLGRKCSILVAGIPLFAGWIMILFATTPQILYASRFISGIGQGVVYAVCPMYIGEIADKEIRGALGTMIKLMVTFGELYGHAVGPFVSYEWFVYASLILPLCFFLTFVWMPESPYWLQMKGRENEARECLIFLKRYSNEFDVEKDLEQVRKTVMCDAENKAGFWDLFSSSRNRKALLITFALQLILQFSGIAAIENYTQEILENGGGEIPAAIAVIVLSTLQLFFGLGATIVVDKAGRKPLLLVTTILAGVTHIVSGIYYFLKSNVQVDTTGWGMVPVVSVIGYECIISLGLNPLSYLMLGELFATNVKGVAVSLSNSFAATLAFVVSKLHQVIMDEVGIYMVFVWYGFTCLVGIFVISFFVPETKGKSLLEIQEELKGNKKEQKKNVPFREMYVNTIA